MKKVAIYGVPRSGTSWLGAIFDSSPNAAYRHQPLFSYAFKGCLSETSTLNDINKFFLDIYATDDDFVLLRENKSKGYYPVFKKEVITHIVYKEARYHNVIENLLNQDKELIVVGILRNPKSVISSWYNAPKEFNKKEWNLIEEWKYAQSKNQGKKEEFYGYEKWKEVAYMFLKFQKKYPDNFYLIKYKDLLQNTIDEVEKVFSFCKIEMNKQTIDFIKKSSNKDMSENAYAVYRKRQSDEKWKSILPKEIIKFIDEDIKGKSIEQFNI